jgi:hypothetical protein
MNISLRNEKWNMLMSEVTILGHAISSREIEIDKEKVNFIKYICRSQNTK